MDKELNDLYQYMRALLEAGFDVQFVLTKGYEAAWIDNGATYSGMVEKQRAAEQVLEVAKELKIDLVSQAERYTAQFTSGSTKDVRPFNEGATA